MMKKTMMASQAIIKKLKQNHLIDSQIDEFQILPKDPDKKIILVHVNRKYVLDSSSNFNSQKEKEMDMDFNKAIVKAKEGKHVRRGNWDNDMYMWWSGKYLLHSHPYYQFQPRDPNDKGYFYVCEKDDVTCDDWELVNCD